MLLFTQYKTTWLTAIGRHCPAALPVKLSALTSHGKLELNLPDMLLLRNKYTKSRTIRSQVWQRASAGK